MDRFGQQLQAAPGQGEVSMAHAEGDVQRQIFVCVEKTCRQELVVRLLQRCCLDNEARIPQQCVVSSNWGPTIAVASDINQRRGASVRQSDSSGLKTRAFARSIAPGVQDGGSVTRVLTKVTRVTHMTLKKNYIIYIFIFIFICIFTLARHFTRPGWTQGECLPCTLPLRSCPAPMS